MVRISEHLNIPDEEILFRYIKSPGPGGQRVNKAATAVELRFDISQSNSLPNGIKARLKVMAGKRVNAKGVLVIKAHSHRTQAQNKEEAIQRLTEFILLAAEPPKSRQKTKPTRTSVENRLATKRHRSRIKKFRRQVHNTDD